ncbi:MAG: 16S rRNA (cytidine(1402)-2'-O)-methyltransferase [Chloroflexi bacterium]|nr:16S rRNA (cytidine(1402)-2'-O)-methyltransferase [Chloroflexota bacterium]
MSPARERTPRSRHEDQGGAVPTLYVVATPIGNLEDVTLRALRVLREVRLIAAEDTRTTRKLLTHFDVSTPVTSFHEHNKEAKLPALLAALKEGDLAVVSEAGVPGISDPGLELVAAAIQQGFPVVPVPGPSAVTTALAVSGFPADRFTALGFLPRRRKERQRLLAALVGEPRTLVAFEAPHRLRSTLEDLWETLGDRPIAVCRELTKLHEEVFRGTAQEALAHFTEPRGEFTLVVAGAPARMAQREHPSAQDTVALARQELARLRAAGEKARAAVSHVAQETGLRRRAVYELWLSLSRQRPSRRGP